jgi:hypothetical protein
VGEVEDTAVVVTVVVVVAISPDEAALLPPVPLAFSSLSSMSVSSNSIVRVPLRLYCNKEYASKFLLGHTGKR